MYARFRALTANEVLSPFGVLLALYVAYFAFLYIPVYNLVYFELMQLGTKIIGFQPQAYTVAVYAYGAFALACGFAGGVVLARRAGVSPLKDFVAQVRDRLVALPVVGRSVTLFTVGVVGWAFGLGATGAQLVALGGASLFDIGTRWEQDPRLVLLAATQIFFVPAMLVGAKGRWAKTFAWAAFAVSVVALGLLGARNLPAKLVVAAFLALGFTLEPRKLVRVALTLAIALALVMGLVGAISKAGIYDAAASPQLVAALVYSDSVGAVYNFDRILALTPSSGLFGGRLLVDSVLAGIPGVDADYANFQIGSYLSGRERFVIDGQVIERSVSLSPTLTGAAYADWGVPGVAVQMLAVGLLLGYMQDRSRRAAWLVPFCVFWAAYVIKGVNAGLHNPHMIYVTILALAAVVFDLAAGQGVPAVAGGTDDE